MPSDWRDDERDGGKVVKDTQSSNENQNNNKIEGPEFLTTLSVPQQQK